MNTEKQSEALELADYLQKRNNESYYKHNEVVLSAAELRRQHSRIAELEAQLEAVGTLQAAQAPTDAEIFALEVAHTKRHETRDCTGYFSEFDIVAFTLSAIAKWGAPALAAPAQAVPEIDIYVWPVPDKCDRIVWRGAYHHLPIQKAAPAQPATQKHRIAFNLTSKERQDIQ